MGLRSQSVTCRGGVSDWQQFHEQMQHGWQSAACRGGASDSAKAVGERQAIIEVSIRCMSRRGVRPSRCSTAPSPRRLNPLHVAEGCQTEPCIFKTGEAVSIHCMSRRDVRLLLLRSPKSPRPLSLNPLHVAEGCQTDTLVHECIDAVSQSAACRGGVSDVGITMEIAAITGIVSIRCMSRRGVRP